MHINATSIRPFIGAKDFTVSRSFYRDLGFTETILTHNLSLFSTAGCSFYLQDAWVKEWVDNTMVFMEVADVHRFWASVQSLDLPARYPGVRLVPIRTEPWGAECFVHDPSGVLWHFGTFTTTP